MSRRVDMGAWILAVYVLGFVALMVRLDRGRLASPAASGERAIEAEALKTELEDLRADNRALQKRESDLAASDLGRLRAQNEQLLRRNIELEHAFHAMGVAACMCEENRGAGQSIEACVDELDVGYDPSGTRAPGDRRGGRGD